MHVIDFLEINETYFLGNLEFILSLLYSSQRLRYLGLLYINLPAADIFDQVTL